MPRARRALLVLVALLAVPGGASAAIPQTPDADLISAGLGGTATGGSQVALAGGGRFTAFVSAGTDFVPGQALLDTNLTCDVFRRDLVSGETVLVSRTPGGIAAGASCTIRPAISSDGSRVAFVTGAADLVNAAAAGQSNGAAQALVADVVAGTLLLASRADGGGGASSAAPVAAIALSGDGGSVAFVSATSMRPDVAAVAQDDVWLRDLAGGSTTLVSAADGSATARTGGGSPSVDQYGRRIAFAAAGPQILVRAPGNVTTVASRTTAGTLIDGIAPSISATGTSVAFLTRAEPYNAPGVFTLQVVVRDLTASTTRIASAPAGSATAGNADSGPPSLSAQGRIVAFGSRATNLGAGDPRGHAQVYVADLRRGALTLASPSRAVAASGGDGDSLDAPGEGELAAPSLAQGGIAVAYDTRAADLVTADTDATRDVVVRRVRRVITIPADSTREASLDGLDGRNVGQQRAVGLDSTQGSGITDLALSADGRWIAFTASQDQYAGDPEGTVTYVRDRLTGEVESVSRASDVGGRPGPLFTGFCSEGASNALSADGRYVTFCAGAQVYRRDRQTGTTEVVSRLDGVAGANQNGSSGYVAMSGDGRYVVFGSNATNLDASATSPWRLFRRDFVAGTTRRVDLRDGSTTDADRGVAYQGMEFHKPSISADGQRVVFTSRDGELEAGSGFGPGGTRAAYLRDLSTTRTYGLNRSASGTWGRLNGGSPTLTLSEHPVITPDGEWAAFTSDAANLVPGKTDNRSAVFRRHLTVGVGGELDGALDLASVPDGVAAGGTRLDGSADKPALTADGARVVFASSSGNANAGVSGEQAYVRGMGGTTTRLVSRADGAAGAAGSGGQMVYPPLTSADGSVVAFASRAQNLEGDASTQSKVMVRTLAGSTGPPVNVTPPALGSAPARGATVQCSPGTWTGGPSFTYEWLRDGSVVASGSAYVPDVSDIGHTLACRVTASNGDGDVTLTSSGAIVIDQPPVTGANPRMDRATVYGDTIACLPPTYTGGAPVLTYRWLLEPPGGGTAAPIPGATDPTHTIAPSEVASWLRCEVTATNSGGASVRVSSRDRVRARITVTQAPTLEGPMTEGSVARCTAGAATIEPAGVNLARTFRLERRNAGGQVVRTETANDAPIARVLAADDTLWFYACVTEWGEEAVGTQVSQSPSRTALPAPPAPPLPGPPAATSPPVVAYYAPNERFCRQGTFAGSIAGLRSEFSWTAHYFGAGGREVTFASSHLRAGLLGPGQILAGINAQYSLSCTQTVWGPNGERTVVRSAIVSAGVYCQAVTGQLAGQPGSGVPVVAGPSAACVWVDTGQDVVVQGAPPLPAPPVLVVPTGPTYTATLAVGCGVAGKPACTFTAMLSVPFSSVKGRATAAAKAVRMRTIATARVRVPRGKTAGVVRFRLSKAAARTLKKRGKLVTTLVVTRKGRRVTVATPLLRLKRAPKPTRPKTGV